MTVSTLTVTQAALCQLVKKLLSNFLSHHELTGFENYILARVMRSARLNVSCDHAEL